MVLSSGPWPWTYSVPLWRTRRDANASARCADVARRPCSKRQSPKCSRKSAQLGQSRASTSCLLGVTLPLSSDGQSSRRRWAEAVRHGTTPMHLFIVGVLLLTYGLALIFALFHAAQPLIGPPTPWLGLPFEVSEERQRKSSAPPAAQSMGHPTALTPSPITGRSNPLGGNPHAWSPIANRRAYPRDPLPRARQRPPMSVSQRPVDCSKQ
jgi:hypothetical protein